MPYSITPFNITAAFLVIFAIYSYAIAPNGGDNLSTFWIIPMIIMAILFAGADYLRFGSKQEKIW